MLLIAVAALQLLTRLEEERDWNKDYQQLLKEEDSEEKFVQLRRLTQEFVDIGRLRHFSLLMLSSNFVCASYH